MGEMEMSNAVPVLLVRCDEDKVIAVTTEEPGSGWLPILGDVAAAVVGVLTSRGTKGGGAVQGRAFTMRPADLRAWDSMLKHGRDGYAYATLWGDNGKIARQAMIQELPSQTTKVGTSIPLDPVALATLASTIQLQASIDKLHTAVVAVGEDVKEILEFLHMEQEADVLAALDTVHHVYTAYAETGEVGSIDWDRVAGLEHVLKKHHRQVLGELDTIRARMEFDSIGKAEKSLKVKKARVRRLIALEYHLLWALNEWTALMLVAKTQRHELTAKDASRAWSVVDDYRAHARKAVQAVHTADGGEVRGRDWWDKLFSNGLVIGSYKDDGVRDDAIENREKVRGATKDTQHLAAAPTPRLILAA
jgi:hypothetical protein